MCSRTFLVSYIHTQFLHGISELTVRRKKRIVQSTGKVHMRKWDSIFFHIFGNPFRIDLTVFDPGQISKYILQKAFFLKEHRRTVICCPHFFKNHSRRKTCDVSECVMVFQTISDRTVSSHG